MARKKKKEKIESLYDFKESIIEEDIIIEEEATIAEEEIVVAPKKTSKRPTLSSLPAAAKFKNNVLCTKAGDIAVFAEKRFAIIAKKRYGGKIVEENGEFIIRYK